MSETVEWLIFIRDNVHPQMIECIDAMDRAIAAMRSDDDIIEAIERRICANQLIGASDDLICGLDQAIEVISTDNKGKE